MTYNDASIRCTHRARSINIVVFLDRQDCRAEDARNRRPAKNADGDKDVLKTTADNGDHGDNEQHVRERQEDVRTAHDDRIPDAAVETGQSTHDQTNQRGDRGGHNSDGQRNARTVDNADENVTTKGVGAKRVLCTRSQQRRLGHGGRVGSCRRTEPGLSPQICGQGNHNDDDDPADTDNGELVLAKTLESVAPQRAGLGGSRCGLGGGSLLLRLRISFLHETYLP